MVNLSPFVEEPCSSSSFSFKHDVFLSFRGIDTRSTFTGHLLDALKRANLKPFFDDETIETGRPLKPELERGIRESRASVVVLSKNYANSPWCLDELVLILEQHRTSEQFVLIPIFYDVEPSHVKNQKGTFGDAIAEHRKKIMAEKIDGWIGALKEVGNKKGEDARGWDEKTFIDKIVKDIGRRLQIPIRSTLPQLIGMDGSIHIITSWLKDDSSLTADILTIIGMGGIGKTSLAEFVYLSHFRDFDTSSYIKDISKTCAANVHNGLCDLQEKLYGHIAKANLNELPIGALYTSQIEIAVDGKKVFLVLDDVDRIEQLDGLLGSKGFHPGSKIIITTRDASLTERCELFKVNAKSKHTQHKLTGLRETESRELLCLHAFTSNDPKEEYAEVLKELLKYCQGHPLALQVLGKSLHKRDVDYWEGCIERLKKDTDPSIDKVLRMSFDTLKSNDKELLKHIACFFVGMDRDVAQTILKACHIETTYGFTNLIDRCLVSIGWDNKLMMHQLLQDMVRFKVSEESPYRPWERSRLWCHEDSYKVLKQKKGTENVLGLTLDMKMLKDENLSETFELETDALSKMDNLMLLQLNFVQMTKESYMKFPEELRWLCMHGFSLKSIPLDLPMKNLVALDMSYSDIESFGVCCSKLHRPQKGQNLTGLCTEEISMFGSLKILNLSFCGQLQSVGGFEKLPALEKLILRNCIGLLEVCESIEQCVELVYVDLSNCTKLQKIPRTVAVKTLLLDGCNLGEALIEISDMDSSKMLESNIIHINKTKTSSANLDVRPRYSKFCTISLSNSLVILSLVDNNLSTESFPMDLSCLSLLKELYLDGNPLDTVPGCLRSLPNLQNLTLLDCRMLTPPQIERDWIICLGGIFNSLIEHVYEVSPYVPSLYSHDLGAFCYEIEDMLKIEPMGDVEEKLLHCLGWTKVDFFNEKRMGTDILFRTNDVLSDIQMCYEFGIFSTIYAGIEMPSWITDRNKGPSISFTIPLSPNNLTGLNYFSVLMTTTDLGDVSMYFPEIKVSNRTKNHTWIYKHYIESVDISTVTCSVILLSHWMFGKNEMEVGDQVTITTITTPGDEVFTKECGVTFVYDDGNMDEEEDVLGYYKSWNHIIGGDLTPFQTTNGEYILNNRQFMNDAMKIGQFHSELVYEDICCIDERVWFTPFPQKKFKIIGHTHEEEEDTDEDREEMDYEEDDTDEDREEMDYEEDTDDDREEMDYEDDDTDEDREEMDYKEKEICFGALSQRKSNLFGQAREEQEEDHGFMKEGKKVDAESSFEATRHMMATGGETKYDDRGQPLNLHWPNLKSGSGCRELVTLLDGLETTYPDEVLVDVPCLPINVGASTQHVDRGSGQSPSTYILDPARDLSSGPLDSFDILTFNRKRLRNTAEDVIQELERPLSEEDDGNLSSRCCPRCRLMDITEETPESYEQRFWGGTAANDISVPLWDFDAILLDLDTAVDFMSYDISVPLWDFEQVPLMGKTTNRGECLVEQAQNIALVARDDVVQKQTRYEESRKKIKAMEAEASIFDIYAKKDASVEFKYKYYPLQTFGMEFWATLLGDNSNGWLEGEHIWIWSLILLDSRPADACWAVMPPTFLFEATMQRSLRFADGSEHPYAAWWDVDRVFIPINIPGKHWMLGNLDLQSWTITIYDSMKKLNYINDAMKILVEFEHILPKYLESIHYWSRRGEEPISDLKLSICPANSVPQQDSLLGDCGVFVCMFIEYMSRGQALRLKKNPRDAAMEYRRCMAEIIYASRVV